MGDLTCTECGHEQPPCGCAEGCNAVCDHCGGVLVNHAAASLRAETGITSSAAHAEADTPGWSDHALGLLGRYSRGHGLPSVMSPFTMEEFRLWAYRHGLARPAEERCWGAVTQKALRQGLIVKVGYAAAASSNNSPKATYRGVV